MKNNVLLHRQANLLCLPFSSYLYYFWYNSCCCYDDYYCYLCVCCVRCILDDVFAPQCSRSQRTTFGSRFFLFTVESGNWIQDFRFAKQVPLSTLSTRPPHLPERGLWWWLCDYVNVLNVTHWGTHFKRLIVISIFHMLFLIRKPLQSGMARLSSA